MTEVFSNLIEEIKKDPIKRFAVTAVSLSVEWNTESLRSQYADLDDEQLWEFAQNNRLSGCIARVLASILPLEETKTHWINTQQNNTFLMRVIIDELKNVGKLFNKHEIAAIVLENGALALCIHPHLEDFTFGDFDLLVQPDQADSIHHLLLSMEYKLEDALDHRPQALRNGKRLVYQKQLNDQIALRFNIQSVLVARNWIREDISQLEHYFNRKKAVNRTGLSILGPEDFLFQLCIHSAAHGYIRTPGINLHLDVLRYLQECTVNWHIFIKQVEQAGAKTRVFFSLLIPHCLFGIPIPDYVFCQLTPPRWKGRLITRWLTEGGLFNPHERKFSRVRYVIFTILLYDRVADFRRGLIPSNAWMKEHYGFQKNLYLPYYHVRRIFDLLFRRLST